VTYNSPKIWQLNLAGLKPFLNIVLIALLLGSLGLGWLVKSALLLVVLLISVPVIGILGFAWWSKQNMVQAACPVCSFELTGLNGTGLDCPSCGEALKVEKGQVVRLSLPNTIDIAAVEVEG
jgi:predicted RNA-binding Zn-ribbon protein involved in translation (DUF1610 family)